MFFCRSRVCRASYCGRMTRHFHEKAGSCQAVFLVVSTIQSDCRPTGGTISLQPFLLGKVFCSAIDTADRRPAGGAQCCIPNSQITDSPYFHPHSLWSDRPGASWVSSIGNGCCRLGAELNVSVFRRRCSWRVPQSPELGDLALDLVKRQLSSAPVVRCDCAMVHILHPLPTADEARSPVFAQPPQPLVSCRAFHHV